MYHIKLDNCCCCEPEIKMEFTFDKKYFEEVVSIARGGFKKIMIADADTDEVIYSRYISDSHFGIEVDYDNIAYCINDLLKYAKYSKGF